MYAYRCDFQPRCEYIIQADYKIRSLELVKSVFAVVAFSYIVRRSFILLPVDFFSYGIGNMSNKYKCIVEGSPFRSCLEISL
jgi:hypothetical protein